MSTLQIRNQTLQRSEGRPCFHVYTRWPEICVHPDGPASRAHSPHSDRLHRLSTWAAGRPRPVPPQGSCTWSTPCPPPTPGSCRWSTPCPPRGLQVVHAQPPQQPASQGPLISFPPRRPLWIEGWGSPQWWEGRGEIPSGPILGHHKVPPWPCVTCEAGCRGADSHGRVHVLPTTPAPSRLQPGSVLLRARV